MTFAIYDRWGEKVFESKDPTIGWDGKFHKKPCNTGVYAWYLYATLHDGTEVSRKGNLTLFR
jgi:gliding motility-associated-like protein